MSSVFDRLTEPKEMADNGPENDVIQSESAVVESRTGKSGIGESTRIPDSAFELGEAQTIEAQKTEFQDDLLQEEEPQGEASQTVVPSIEETPIGGALSPGAGGVQYTARDIKEVSQELLRYGLLDAESKLKLYQTAVTHHKAINDILEPFDLTLKIDDVRGLAYVVVSEGIFTDGDDEWSHPLIRKQRLNMEQSLLLAILRELYVAHELEHGVGSTNAVIPVEELTPRLRIYLGELGSDNAEEKRTRNLLEKLKSHGVVSEVDKYNQVTVRPIITHLANPENLSRLLDLMKRKTGLVVEERVEETEQSQMVANNETLDQELIDKTEVEVNP